MANYLLINNQFCLYYLLNKFVFYYFHFLLVLHYLSINYYLKNYVEGLVVLVYFIVFYHVLIIFMVKTNVFFLVLGEEEDENVFLID